MAAFLSGCGRAALNELVAHGQAVLLIFFTASKRSR